MINGVDELRFVLLVCAAGQSDVLLRLRLRVQTLTLENCLVDLVRVSLLGALAQFAIELTI